MVVKYVYGDILSIKKGVICHQCNCVMTEYNKKGGLAKAIFNTYPQTDTYKKSIKRQVGTNDIINVSKKLTIVNMYAQYNKGYDSKENRLEWFESCLNKIPYEDIYMPYKIGCGLGGGKWEEYLKILEKSDKNIVIVDNTRTIICISWERNTKCFYQNIESDILDNKDSIFVFGDCSGVDECAKKICEKYKIKHKVFKANWKRYGKSAGPIRNSKMIGFSDKVLAYHSDLEKSKGTKNLINLAKSRNIPYKLTSRFLIGE